MLNWCVVTVATTSHLAGVAALSESLRLHHPDAVLHTCLVEGFPERRTPLPVIAGTCFSASDCFASPSDWSRFSFKYPAFPLAAALKSRALLHVLETKAVEKVLFLDSDIFVTGALEPLLNSLETGSIVITPHRLCPAIGKSATSRLTNFTMRGVFNSGVLGIRNDQSGRDFVHWWANVTESECINDSSRRIFVDQSWLDFVPAMFPNANVCRNPGVNVAYWNLDERNVVCGSSGWMADGVSLSSFHFSGFDAREPERLSRYIQPEHDNFEFREIIAPLSRRYADCLMRNGFLEFTEPEYKFRTLSDGTPIEPSWRELIRLGLDNNLSHLEDPFDANARVDGMKLAEWYRRKSNKVRAIATRDLFWRKIKELYSSVGERLGNSRQFRAELQRWR